jgi:hypothetical protein
MRAEAAFTNSTPSASVSGRGWTPNELAALIRVSPDRVRSWIASGELGAINTARVGCGRPRFVVLPHHLAAFERRRAAAQPTPAPRRGRRLIGAVDYYADTDGGST